MAFRRFVFFLYFWDSVFLRFGDSAFLCYLSFFCVSAIPCFYVLCVSMFPCVRVCLVFLRYCVFVAFPHFVCVPCFDDSVFTCSVFRCLLCFHVSCLCAFSAMQCFFVCP